MHEVSVSIEMPMRDVPTVFTVQATNGLGRQVYYPCRTAGEALDRMRLAIDEDCSIVFVVDQEGYLLDEYDLALLSSTSRPAPKTPLRVVAPI